MWLHDQHKVTGVSGLVDTFSFCFDVNSVCIIYATNICLYIFIGLYPFKTHSYFFVCAIFVCVDSQRNCTFYISEFQLWEFKYSNTIAAKFLNDCPILVERRHGYWFVWLSSTLNQFCSRVSMGLLNLHVIVLPLLQAFWIRDHYNHVLVNCFAKSSNRPGLYLFIICVSYYRYLCMI